MDDLPALQSVASFNECPTRHEKQNGESYEKQIQHVIPYATCSSATL
jgi:hypothetical protein